MRVSAAELPLDGATRRCATGLAQGCTWDAPAISCWDHPLGGVQEARCLHGRWERRGAVHLPHALGVSGPSVHKRDDAVLGPGFWPSHDRLKKTDNRLDHFLSREQLVIVVIGVGKYEERLGSYRGIVQTPTVLDGHDAIEPACDG